MTCFKVNGMFVEDHEIKAILDKLFQDPSPKDQVCEETNSEEVIDIDDELASTILDADKSAYVSRTNLDDYWALNTSLPQQNRITQNQFWKLARYFDKAYYADGCRQPPYGHRFTPITHINKGCMTDKFLSQLKAESKSHPVVILFSKGQDKAYEQYSDLSITYPDISFYHVDISGAKDLPHAVLIHDGKIKYKGDSSDFIDTGVYKETIDRAFKYDHLNDVLGPKSTKRIINTAIEELIWLPSAHPLAGVINRLFVDTSQKLKRLDADDKKEIKKVYDELEFYLRSFKSPNAFHSLAEEACNSTNIHEERKAGFLVPASGHLVSPLITAMALIDHDKIDSARFIFTETDKDTAKEVMKALKYWAKQKPHMTEPTIRNLEPYCDENGESVDGEDKEITFYWRSVPIRVEVKINDESDDKYFDREDAVRADVIVYHDIDHGVLFTPGDVKILPDALEFALDKVDDGNHKPRILAINDFGNDRGFISPFTKQQLFGNYGHGEPHSVGDDSIAGLKVSMAEVAFTHATGIVVRLDEQPLLKALKSRKELELLIGLGIAADDIIIYDENDETFRKLLRAAGENDEKQKTDFFDIQRGNVLHLGPLKDIWRFAIDLHGRVKSKDKAAINLRYLMTAMLIQCLGKGEGIGEWAKDQISSFDEKGSDMNRLFNEGFKDTLEALGLLNSSGRADFFIGKMYLAMSLQYIRKALTFKKD